MARISFNSANVAPQESFTPIPAGVYLAQATDSDVAATKSGGEMVKLTFEVLQGPYARRKVFGNINVRNPNADAERIGQSQLSALCHAVGLVGQLNDTAQLHLRPVMIRVKIRKDDTGQYGDRNEVTGYEAVAGGAAPGMPVAAPGGFPPPQAGGAAAAAMFPPAPQAVPVAAAAQPVAQPPQAAAAPWARRQAAPAQA